MLNLSTKSPDPSNKISIPPILRSLEFAETTVAGVKIGSTIVRSEVLLSIPVYSDSDVDQPVPESAYLGEIEINHEPAEGAQKVVDELVDEVGSELPVDDFEASSQWEEATEIVKHSYIDPNSVYAPEENRHPRFNPFLAPN